MRASKVIYIFAILIACASMPIFAQETQSTQVQQAIESMKKDMQQTINQMQIEMDQKVNQMQKKIDLMQTSIKKERQDFNDNMRSMQVALDTEREVMRESAGGAPEALRSKSGSANVRIGGKVQVRYYAEFDPNYNYQSESQPGGGQYATRLGWTMDTASVTFDMQFNEDLSMFIDVRPSDFDKAYFQWNNIGGSGLGTQVGYIGIYGGMYSSSTDPWGRVFITNPVVKEFSQAFVVQQGSSANNPGDDITRMGLKLYYTFNDEITVTGAVFSPSDLGDTGGLLGGYDSDINSSILAPNGDARNNGFMDCSLSVEYKPAIIEGLLFSATYVGLADLGQGTYTVANRRGSSYSPQFDLGVAYLTDKYGVYLESAYTLNPGYYSDTYNFSVSLGADYHLTEKLSAAVGAAYGYFASGSELYKSTVNPSSGSSYPHFSSSAVRVRVGARYDFANGVWVKAEYSHLISTASGMKDNSVKDSNHFIFETGLIF